MTATASTDTITARTAAIRKELEELLAAPTPYESRDLIGYDVLSECDIATAIVVSSAVDAIKEGRASIGDVAKLFATIYTEEDVEAFCDAYADNAPELYDLKDDSETDTPWCLPWGWDSTDVWHLQGSTPAEMGKEWAEKTYSDCDTALKDWKEQQEEEALYSKEPWEA